MLNKLEQYAVIVHTSESLRERGSWTGETHLQKSLFFLQQLLRVPLGYRFTLYKHGPYSFDLHDDLGRMRAYGFLQIETRQPYGPSYGPGQAAQKLLERCNPSIEHYMKNIKYISERLNRANVRELERFATALFVGIESPTSKREELAHKIIELKPHITLDQAERALHFVSNLSESAKNDGLIPEVTPNPSVSACA